MLLFSRNIFHLLLIAVLAVGMNVGTFETCLSLWPENGAVADRHLANHFGHEQKHSHHPGDDHQPHGITETLAIYLTANRPALSAKPVLLIGENLALLLLVSAALLRLRPHTTPLAGSARQLFHHERLLRALIIAPNSPPADRFRAYA